MGRNLWTEAKHEAQGEKLLFVKLGCENEKDNCAILHG